MRLSGAEPWPICQAQDHQTQEQVRPAPAAIGKARRAAARPPSRAIVRITRRTTAVSPAAASLEKAARPHILGAPPGAAETDRLTRFVMLLALHGSQRRSL